MFYNMKNKEKTKKVFPAAFFFWTIFWRKTAVVGKRQKNSHLSQKAKKPKLYILVMI